MRRMNIKDRIKNIYYLQLDVDVSDNNVFELPEGDWSKIYITFDTLGITATKIRNNMSESVGSIAGADDHICAFIIYKAATSIRDGNGHTGQYGILPLGNHNYGSGFVAYNEKTDELSFEVATDGSGSSEGTAIFTIIE